MVRRFLLPIWAAALLALALTGLASAQPGPADEGEYQILQARYGTANRNIDVTDRLKELARQDRGIRVENDTFRDDPDPGQVKLLRIQARGRDGQVRTFDYDEGSVVDGRQFTGWSSGNWGERGGSGGWAGAEGPGRGAGRDRDAGEYVILEARYGTPMRNVDVTQRLKELARQDRPIRVANDTFGADPTPNQVKKLRIIARGRDGQARIFEYDEGSRVDGAQYTGWRGGEWGKGGWNGGWGNLQIVSASYGFGSQQRDVTQRLRSRIVNDRLELAVDNEIAGSDPAPEAPKVLAVTYTIGSGRPQYALVNERRRLSIP